MIKLRGHERGVGFLNPNPLPGPSDSVSEDVITYILTLYRQVDA